MELRGKYKVHLIVLIATVIVQSACAFAPTWELKSYSDSVTLVGEIVIQDYSQYYQVDFPEINAGDYIGAFVDGECRLITQMYVSNQKLYIYGEISKKNQDEVINEALVEFYFWDEQTGESYLLHGTSHFNSTDSIGSYEQPLYIGKPNVNNTLKKLEVSGVKLEPEFSPDISNYKALYYTNSSFPDSSKYIIETTDSRAEYFVSFADGDTTMKTTITVVAENDSIFIYELVFVEQICGIDNFKIVGANNICSDEPNPILSLDTVYADVYWFNTEPVFPYDGGVLRNTFQLDNSEPGTKNVWAIQKNEFCQSIPVHISYEVFEKPEVPTIIAPEILSSTTDSIKIEVLPTGGILSGSGVHGYYFYPQEVSSGLYTIAYTISNQFCFFSVEATIIVEELMVGLDYSQFNKAIAEANMILNNAIVGDSVGQYSQENITIFSNILLNSYLVKDTTTSQLIINEESEYLSIKTKHFKEAAIPDSIKGIRIVERSKSLIPGEKFIPQVQFLPPGASADTIVWSASDKAVASVDSLSGEILGVGVGQTNVYVQYKDLFFDNIFITIDSPDILINLEELNYLISEAEFILDTVTVGDKVNNFPNEAFDILSEAILHAKEVVGNAANQLEVNEEYLILNDEISTFLSSQISASSLSINIEPVEKKLYVGQSFTPVLHYFPEIDWEPATIWSVVTNGEYVVLDKSTGKVIALHEGIVEVQVEISLGTEVISDKIKYNIKPKQISEFQFAQFNYSNSIYLYTSEKLYKTDDLINDFSVYCSQQIYSLQDAYIYQYDSTVLVIELSDELYCYSDLELSYVNRGNLWTATNHEFSDMSSIYVEHGYSTRIVEEYSNVDININNDRINVSLSGNVMQFSVVSLTGVIHLVDYPDSNSISIPLSLFSPGVYILSLNTDNGKVAKTIYIK